MKSKQLKKGDFVIFAFIIVLAVLCTIPFINSQKENLVCEISSDNKVIHKIALKDDFSDTITVKSKNGECVIKIQNNSVWFESSDCPDKVCINSGKLTRSNQIAVCLPNKVVIKLVGQKNEVDAIVR